MQNKRGAIELSMTTIIVIVLGVTLLILGLAFVRTIFGKVSDLTTKSFEEADSQIKNLGTIDKELTVASTSVDLKQGDSRGVGVVMANLGQDDARFQVKTSLPAKTAGAAKFTCEIAETESATSEEVMLKSGEQRSARLLIIDNDTPLGTYVCKVALVKDGRETLSDSVIIRVVS